MASLPRTLRQIIEDAAHLGLGGVDAAEAEAAAAVTAAQVRAMHAAIENMAGSFANYLQALEDSEELRERLKVAAADELRGVFDLIVRRARAVAESAQQQTPKGPTS